MKIVKEILKGSLIVLPYIMGPILLVVLFALGLKFFSGVPVFQTLGVFLGGYILLGFIGLVFEKLSEKWD